MARGFGGQNTFWRLAIGTGRPASKSSITKEVFLNKKLTEEELKKIEESANIFCEQYFAFKEGQELPKDNIIITGSKKLPFTLEVKK